MEKEEQIMQGNVNRSNCIGNRKERNVADGILSQIGIKNHPPPFLKNGGRYCFGFRRRIRRPRRLRRCFALYLGCY